MVIVATAPCRAVDDPAKQEKNDVTPSIDHLPPQDLTAEASVLGSMLLDPHCIPSVATVLEADAFYSPDHQVVYRAIVLLSDAGKAADLVTLADALKASNDLERVGGPGFLVDLLATVPSSAHAEQYAAIVAEKARRRRLIAAGRRVATLAYDQSSDIEAVLQSCESEFYEAASLTQATTDLTVAAVLGEVLAAVGRGEGAGCCLPTGYHDLDEILVGLPAGALVIVGARPSMGKSTLARNILLKATVPRFRRPVGGPAIPALMFSIEDTKKSIVQAMLCCLAKVNGYALRSGRLGEADMQRIKPAAAALRAAPLWVDDRVTLTVSQMLSQAKRLKLQVPELGLIVVDYLQLLTTTTGRTREQEVADIAKGLKHMARDLEVPVLGLSQLSRAVEARADQTPRLSDLRESGALEQDADIVLLLCRPRFYNPMADPRQLDVDVAKHRSGPTGRLQLAINLPYTRVDDWIGDMGEQEGDVQ